MKHVIFNNKSTPGKPLQTCPSKISTPKTIMWHLFTSVINSVNSCGSFLGNQPRGSWLLNVFDQQRLLLINTYCDVDNVSGTPIFLLRFNGIIEFRLPIFWRGSRTDIMGWLLSVWVPWNLWFVGNGLRMIDFCILNKQIHNIFSKFCHVRCHGKGLEGCYTNFR